MLPRTTPLRRSRFFDHGGSEAGEQDSGRASGATGSRLDQGFVRGREAEVAHNETRDERDAVPHSEVYVPWVADDASVEHGEEAWDIGGAEPASFLPCPSELVSQTACDAGMRAEIEAKTMFIHLVRVDRWQTQISLRLLEGARERANALIR